MSPGRQGFLPDGMGHEEARQNGKCKHMGTESGDEGLGNPASSLTFLRLLPFSGPHLKGLASFLCVVF